MVSYAYVKWLTVLCCMLSMVFAENSRIKLEDIERDTLAKEKQAQPQIRGANIQNLPPLQYYATPSPEQAVGPHQFAPDARQWNNLPQPQQQFVTLPQQQQYFPQQQQNIPQQQYQFQYVQDNNLYQQYVPQYQTQNQSPYLYLPQGSAPAQQGSKPGITYVQYVDPSTELLRNPKIQELIQNPKDRASSHNLAGLIQKYAHTNYLPVNYQQPAPQTYRQQGQRQPIMSQSLYVIPQQQQQQQQPAPTNLHPLYERTNQVLAQQRYLVPGITYLRDETPVHESQQAQQSTANVVYQKKEPQSLLESYVPSVLQIQYYKQLEQQQQANAVPQFGKLGAGIEGKTDYLKIFSVGSSPYEYELPKYEH